MTDTSERTASETGASPLERVAVDSGALKRMKWSGWGVEGVGFHHDDKPAFAPFVAKAVGIDVTVDPGAKPDFDGLDIPASRIGEELLGRLSDAVGAEHVGTDPHDRVVHTYGKSLRDLLRIRGNLIERTPDVVVYPADEDAVRRVVAVADEADAVLIPFGGGSNIVGSTEPLASEQRVVISLDLGRLGDVLDIDEESGLARIQAGALGPDVEEQLGARGFTLGHFPDSFTHSTIGGWVATRSSGMQSDRYGDIADITKGLRLVRPDGVVVVSPRPSTSTGPSVREMVLGSEGRLGVITEVTVQVHRVPERREILAYFFPSFAAGLDAMRAIATSDASPSVTRVSDAGESAFSFSTQKSSGGLGSLAQKGLLGFLKRRGWDLDELCLSFVGYEGSPRHVDYERSIVERIVKRHGGIGVGKGPGALYDQKKFDTPYIRDFLLDRGGNADVSETAAPWSRLKGVYDGAIAAVRDTYRALGTEGWVMCHLSHSYHSGACLYFTFAFAHGDDPIADYDAVKSAIQSSFLANGATLSHHHAVGLEHAPWFDEDVSEAGAGLVRGLFAATDPASRLNPGKITG